MSKFKRGQWVTDDEDIAKVLTVYDDDGMFDLVLYDRDGTKVGRKSPAGTGPKNFEPCCNQSDWREVKEPQFPLKSCYYLHELLEPV